MEIKYYAKNYKITQNFKEILEKKLAKLGKYFPKDYDVKVVCSEQNKDEKLEVTINADGLYIRSEVVSDNMYNNIDLAMPKIEKQIVKNSERYKQKFKNVDKNMFEFLSDLPLVTNGKVVKTKDNVSSIGGSHYINSGTCIWWDNYAARKKGYHVIIWENLCY